MHGAPTVAILGGNPVVGKALESLLESTDYAVRFFPENLAESAELPVGVRIALVMPALSNQRSDALITRLMSASGPVCPSIIELITTPTGDQNGHRIYVSWPCSVEVLKQNIGAALADGFRPATASQDPAHTSRLPPNRSHHKQGELNPHQLLQSPVSPSQSTPFSILRYVPSTHTFG
jgi:hypothetical protein